MTFNVPPETRQFNRDVQHLLQMNTPRGRSLRGFIHQSLRQFGLAGYCCEFDVLTEAYLRGVRYTLRGNQIVQSHAWLRSTAYNIIREWKRERARYCAVAFEELLDQGVGAYYDDSGPWDMGWQWDMFWAEAEIQRVVQAFHALDEGDRTLLHWKVVEMLSWQLIHARLAAQGERVSLPTLRKRGQRALERLRQKYHQQE